MRHTHWPPVILVSIMAGAAHAEPLDGRWEGAIHIGGMDLGIAVTMRATDKGPEATIDIPQQGAVSVPLRNVTLTPAKVHLELPAGPGLAVFDGALKNGRAASVAIAGANHLFQPGAKTGGLSEYATLPKEHAPGVLDAIEQFVVEVTR